MKGINKQNSRKKKIGVFGLPHDLNVGNILLKYAMAKQLTSLGFEPYIIGEIKKNPNISFISKFIKIKIIRRYLDINPKDFDILIVNSDQTWRCWHCYNLFFLRFAQKWNITKFIYGASIATNKWFIPIKVAKFLRKKLKSFSGISVRENGTIPLVQKYLGIKPLFVLDPTLLIDKKNYLKLIHDYKGDFDIHEKYICNYKLNNLTHMDEFLTNSSEQLKYMIIVHDNIKRRDDYIQRFLNCIYYSQAVVTNSYHGTIFSIIFNKPFVVYQIHDDERLNTLNEIFNIENILYKNNNTLSSYLNKKYENLKYEKINETRKKVKIDFVDYRDSVYQTPQINRIKKMLSEKFEIEIDENNPSYLFYNIYRCKHFFNKKYNNSINSLVNQF